MAEQFCDIGAIRLCYETFGDPGDPTVLLVMGLGTQMVAWPEPFCAELAGRGFQVVRFDNRDVGRSSRIAGRPPTRMQIIRRDPAAARYTLPDMAADAVGLLDCLGVGAAHVVGASMGGMIAQIMAARHPERVLSLVSVMSSTGHRWTGQPALKLMSTFFRPSPRERGAWVEYMVKLWGLIGSPGFPRDDAALRAQLELAYDRGHDAAGSGRQLAAVLASGDRTRELAAVRAPTLVIHGGADKLVAPSGGKRTADSIPGARLMTVDGMGHDLPRGVWARIIDGIVDNARRAAAPAAASAELPRASFARPGVVVPGDDPGSSSEPTTGGPAPLSVPINVTPPEEPPRT